MRTEDFWNETPFETSCRYIGWARSNGAGPYRRDPETGMTDMDVDAFVDDIEDMKRRFPDKPGRQRVMADG